MASTFDDLYRKCAVLARNPYWKHPFYDLGVYLLGPDFNRERELRDSEVLGLYSKTKAKYLARLLDAFGGRTHLHATDPYRPVFERLNRAYGGPMACLIMLGLGGEHGVKVKARAAAACGLGQKFRMGLLFDDEPGGSSRHRRSHALGLERAAAREVAAAASRPLAVPLRRLGAHGSIFDTGEYRRLAAHSVGFRAMWRRALALGDGPEVSAMGRSLAIAAQAVRIAMGEEAGFGSGRVFDHLPRDLREGMEWLQRPEAWLVGAYPDGKVPKYPRMTPNFQNMRMHAELNCSGYRKMKPHAYLFMRRMYKICDLIRVPIFAERVFLEEEEARRLYVVGEMRMPPKDNPFCYGAAIQFGHYAEREFRGYCLEFLNGVAGVAAKAVGVTVSASRDRPGEFVVADRDGVVFSHDEGFPEEGQREEFERLAGFYMERLPWQAPPGGSGLDPALWSDEAAWPAPEGRGFLEEIRRLLPVEAWADDREIEG